MELNVMKHCCSDLSYEQIAIKIGTTKRSVEGYRDSIFKKLNINSRTAIAMYAIQFGLVTIDFADHNNSSLLTKKKP